MTNFKPTRNNLLCTRTNYDEETSGGIVIPNSNRLPKSEAQVISVGPKVENIKSGDTIRFSSTAGIPITIGNKDFIILRDTEVLLSRRC